MYQVLVLKYTIAHTELVLYLHTTVWNKKHWKIRNIY